MSSVEQAVISRCHATETTGRIGLSPAHGAPHPRRKHATKKWPYG